MLKIGDINGLEIYLERVLHAEKIPTCLLQAGDSCRVGVVKSRNTPLTLQDAVDKKFCFGDVLDICYKINVNDAGKFFCPGFDSYRFDGNGFGSNKDGQFVLCYIIRPVNTLF